MFVLHLMFLQCHAIVELKQDMTFLPYYAIADASKGVLCFAIADVMFLLAYAIEMTGFIDMFVIDMLVLCLMFLLCYAIADLKQEERRAGEKENQRPMRRTSFSRALPCLVVICKVTKPCYNKTFHVGSLFELDAETE